MPNSEFSQGDVVRVPFPLNDRNARQHRPALAVSHGGVGEGEGLLWVVMITSAENRSWPGDVSLGLTYGEAGLPAPSVIRPCKIATIEAAHAEKLGRIKPTTMAQVRDQLRTYMGV